MEAVTPFDVFAECAEVEDPREVMTIKDFCTQALAHSVNEQQITQSKAADLICDWFGYEDKPLLAELYKQTS